MVPGCPRRRRALDRFKRIALNHPNPEKAACTRLNTTTRSKAQIAAAMAAERLAARKASGWFGGTVQTSQRAFPEAPKEKSTPGHGMDKFLILY